MAFRSLTRKLALSLPRVRRFYDYTGELRSDRDKLLRQLACAQKEYTDLELQHYVLRSDFQRVVALNDELRTRLQEAEQLVGELRPARDAFATEI